MLKDLQSCFRLYYGTETDQLLFLTFRARGLLCVLVWLILTGALDTVDHHILLQRLGHLIGIKGSTSSQFKSYLSDLSLYTQTMNPI